MPRREPPGFLENRKKKKNKNPPPAPFSSDGGQNKNTRSIKKEKKSKKKHEKEKKRKETSREKRGVGSSILWSRGVLFFFVLFLLQPPQEKVPHTARYGPSETRQKKKDPTPRA